MDALDIAILAAGGLVAGVVNTLAGAGSMLTVPLLVLLGLPGTIANGTNRIGILVQNVSAAWRFRRDGVDALSGALPVLLPVGIGALVGAIAISRVADETFERGFGLIMLATLAPMLRRRDPSSPDPHKTWRPATQFAVYFGIGAYGGAFQAGVGLLLLLALARSGRDLVTANAIKVVVVAAVTAVAVPVFVIQGQVSWGPALVLAAGFAAGGIAGASMAVRSGERLIRPVIVVAVIALALRMLWPT